MPAYSIAQTRRLWFIIWGGITVAPLIYGFIAPMIPTSGVQDPGFGTMRTAFLAVAAANFALGFLIMRTAAHAAEAGNLLATRGDGLLATPAAFQLRSVLAMAMFESVAVFGFVLFFMGAPPLQYWPWGIASVAGQIAVVLPDARSYWSELERTSGGTGAIG